MESAESKAARYERRFPNTGVPLEQAAERQERLDRKARLRDGGRVSRFVTVPELPWRRAEA
jgi:hypothetical protein